MKKISAMLLAVLMVCCVAGCSSEIDAFAEIDSAALPSKVDLRNFNGKNYVTPVKKQKNGDCWSFSLAGSAEIAYLYANDLGVAAGQANNNIDFSEKYIAWYLYHGIMKEDVVKGKVRSSQIGEGFDPSAAEREDVKAVYNIGGEFVHYANFFGSGFGPVDESVKIDDEYPYEYGGASKEEWILPLNAEYRNAPDCAYLRDAHVLPSPAGVDENGDYLLNESGLNAIKSELYQGHGVSIAFFSNGSFNMEHIAAYYSGDFPADHAVTVVGYDDDFPKEYFTNTNNDGEPIESTTPPGDGAFIIKNSWGTFTDDEDYLDDGYFYLSYYDHSLSSPLSYVFDSSDSLDPLKINYDQYDLMMTGWYGSTDYDSEVKTANVFDAEENESLYQISYRTASPKTEVSYQIYKDVEDGAPSSGTLLEQGVTDHRYAGSHKIDLKKAYPLQKGEEYSVVLTMKRVVDEDGDMVYTEVFPYATEFSSGLKVLGIINSGESYLYSDGKWSDMASMKDSLIERAFGQCVDELGSKRTYTPIKLDSKETFTVDNYPIKAILVLTDAKE